MIFAGSSKSSSFDSSSTQHKKHILCFLCKHRRVAPGSFPAFATMFENNAHVTGTALVSFRDVQKYKKKVAVMLGYVLQSI